MWNRIGHNGNTYKNEIGLISYCGKTKEMFVYYIERIAKIIRNFRMLLVLMFLDHL